MVEIIKTQLLDGDVYGRRILTMQTRSVTLSIFPKNNIEPYGDESVLEMHCVYFLLNVHEKQIYIGKTENLLNRLKDHKYNKNFWDTLFVFTSPEFKEDPYLIDDIEKVAISEIKQQVEWSYVNIRNEKDEKIENKRKEICDKFFEIIKVLSNIAGCQAFSPERIIPTSENSNTHRIKRKEFSPNRTKAQMFYFGESEIVNGVGNLLKSFATQYMNLHKESSIEEFVELFNDKAHNEHPFYAFEDTILDTKTEKLYKEITINRKKFFYLKQQKDTGYTLCQVMTEMGIFTKQVDPNNIVYPSGIYKFKSQRANIIAEIMPYSNDIIVKKESYKIEKNNDREEKFFPHEVDTPYKTFNQIHIAFIGYSGCNFKKNFIFQDGRNLSEIDNQLLIEQAQQKE